MSVDCEYDVLDTQACKFVWVETTISNVASNYSPTQLFYIKETNYFTLNGVKINNFLGAFSTSAQTLATIRNTVRLNTYDIEIDCGSTSTYTYNTIFDIESVTQVVS